MPSRKTTIAAFLFATSVVVGVARASTISFFDTPRKGANCQNTRVDAAYWQAAADAGIEFIRLAPMVGKATHAIF